MKRGDRDMASRRDFLRSAGGLAAVAAAGPGLLASAPAKAAAEPLFRISLAEWSFFRTLRAEKMTNLDFPVVARTEFGIDSVEYVNTFFMDKANDKAYLAQLKQRCDDNGVASGLIMCDREGALGDADEAARTKAVENHYKWVTAAATLGCHSIRVNAQSTGTFGAQLDHAVDGLRRLSQFGAQHNINVIVENHGGWSSHGKWLASVIEQVGLPNCGTLPDFGNFRITPEQNYDRYLGVQELMPFAKGVSAKSYEFDAQGNETTIDYFRILKIVTDAGYRGYVGIEYEGKDPDDHKGVRQTKALLERVREQLSKKA
jgi:L-ribulose-5-phosphate 3-epimerase